MADNDYNARNSMYDRSVSCLSSDQHCKSRDAKRALAKVCGSLYTHIAERRNRIITRSHRLLRQSEELVHLQDATCYYTTTTKGGP
jgi:hypothetical protein